MPVLPPLPRRMPPWSWMAAWLGVSTGLSALGLVMAAPWTRSPCLWGNGICTGVRVEGEAIDSANVAAALESRGRALAARSIDVTLSGVAGWRKRFTLG